MMTSSLVISVIECAVDRAARKVCSVELYLASSFLFKCKQNWSSSQGKVLFSVFCAPRYKNWSEFYLANLSCSSRVHQGVYTTG